MAMGSIVNDHTAESKTFKIATVSARCVTTQKFCSTLWYVT